VRWCGDAIGDASTLKMCYGGLTKGVQALATTLMISAQHAGIGPAFEAELKDSQQALLGWLDRSLPRMPPRPIAGSPRWRRARPRSRAPVCARDDDRCRAALRVDRQDAARQESPRSAAPIPAASDGPAARRVLEDVKLKKAG